MTASDQQHPQRTGMPTDPPGLSPAAGGAAAGAAVDPHLLQRLADAHGVGSSFQGWDGLPHTVAEESLI